MLAATPEHSHNLEFLCEQQVSRLGSGSTHVIAPLLLTGFLLGTKRRSQPAACVMKGHVRGAGCSRFQGPLLVPLEQMLMQPALSVGGKSKMSRRVSTLWEQVTPVGGGQRVHTRMGPLVINRHPSPEEESIQGGRRFSGVTFPGGGDSS